MEDKSMKIYIAILCILFTGHVLAENCKKKCRHDYNISILENMNQCKEPKHQIKNNSHRLGKQICISKILHKAATDKTKCESKCPTIKN
jgi:hypothetical protein